jgi:hypothetical protein
MTLLQAERTEIETAAHRYFTGRMSESEAEDFEIRLLEDAELAREAEATQRLRGGLRALKTRAEIEGLTRSRPWQSPVALAAAAAVLVVVVASLFYFARLAQPVSVLATTLATLRPLDGASATASGTYLIAERRGASNDVIIQRPHPAAPVRLEVLPSAESPTGQYELEISDSKDSFGRISAAANAQGFLAVFLDVSRIKAGRYVLTLTSPAGTTTYPLVLKD